MTSLDLDGIDRPELDGSFARAWTAGFARVFLAEAGHLNRLDRLAGDGDFGTNVRTALVRADQFVEADDPQTFADVFFAVSKGFLHTGGTSGPLFGMWFREVAKATARPASTGGAASLASLAEGAASGLAVVQRLGAARVGDKTMVDALSPASDALTAAAGAGRALGPALDEAARAARSGALATVDLVAHRGRASYVGEVARGVLDPGAATAALFLEAGSAVATGIPVDPGWLLTEG